MSQPCPNCGTLNLDSYRFCSNCGELLRPGEDANAAPPMSSSSPAPGSAFGETTSPLTASHMIPPSPPVGPEPAPAASMSQPEQPSTGGEQPAFPAYVVKTSPDAEAASSQTPTTPMGGFVPPAPGGGVYSQPAAPQQPSPYAGYQAYGSTSSTPASGGGGVYAPYAPGSPQAAALEKPKETRSWLVPVVVVAALLLVGLAAIGIYATQNKANTGQGQTPISGSTSNNGGSQGSTGGPQPTVRSTQPAVGGTGTQPTAVPTSTALPASASEEDKVKEVIRRSNEMQINAWEQLNTDLLSQYYADQALKDNIDMVNQLKQRNLSAEPHMDSLKIETVVVDPDGTKATATTTETWTVTFTNNADKRKTVQGPDTLHETYYLVKKDGKWYVSKLDIPGSGSPAAPTPTVSSGT